MFSTSEQLQPERTIRSRLHRYIFIAGIMAVCIGMPSSNALNSLGQAVLVINWLLEGNLIYKLKSLWKNKPALVLCSVYIMHVIGLLYSTNFNYGLEDINKKVPLLIFPLVLSTTDALSEKERKLVLLSFMVAVTCVTFNGGWLLVHHEIIDIHDISPYIAPVRLAMMIDLSIFILAFYLFNKKISTGSAVAFLWIAWLVFFLFVMQSLTAVVMAIIICLALLLNLAFKAIRQRKTAIGVSIILLFTLGLGTSVGYIIYFNHSYFPAPDIVDVSKIPAKTINGNVYSDESWNYSTENGHYEKYYVCWKELKSEWNKHSAISYDSNDLKGNTIRFTLERYMTSLNLTKDSAGFQHLTRNDIKAIELGIPNYRFNSISSMNYRLYQVFWEINDWRHGGDLNGHSVTMRLEYWRIALVLIQRHLLMGSGTGDVRKSFDEYYDATHSKLLPEWRLRAHNQYLEITVGFGIIGLLWFVFSLFYPAIKTKKISTYFYFVFWMIFMISLFTEDTLETEAGSTFYALFNSFFLFL